MQVHGRTAGAARRANAAPQWQEPYKSAEPLAQKAAPQWQEPYKGSEPLVEWVQAWVHVGPMEHCPQRWGDMLSISPGGVPSLASDLVKPPPSQDFGGDFIKPPPPKDDLIKPPPVQGDRVSAEVPAAGTLVRAVSTPVRLPASSSALSRASSPGSVWLGDGRGTPSDAFFPAGTRELLAHPGPRSAATSRASSPGSVFFQDGARTPSDVFFPAGALPLPRSPGAAPSLTRSRASSADSGSVFFQDGARTPSDVFFPGPACPVPAFELPPARACGLQPDEAYPTPGPNTPELEEAPPARAAVSQPLLEAVPERTEELRQRRKAKGGSGVPRPMEDGDIPAKELQKDCSKCYRVDVRAPGFCLLLRGGSLQHLVREYHIVLVACLDDATWSPDFAPDLTSCISEGCQIWFGKTQEWEDGVDDDRLQQLLQFDKIVEIEDCWERLQLVHGPVDQGVKKTAGLPRHFQGRALGGPVDQKSAKANGQLVNYHQDRLMPVEGFADLSSMFNLPHPIAVAWKPPKATRFEYVWFPDMSFVLREGDRLCFAKPRNVLRWRDGAEITEPRSIGCDSLHHLSSEEVFRARLRSRHPGSL